MISRYFRIIVDKVFDWKYNYSFSCSDEEASTTTTRKKRQPPRAKGEMTLQDLPPIEDLHISVPHEQCQAIGVIKSVVDPLGIILI